MKYYGVIGESTQVINETKKPVCPKGYIKMNCERPSPEHIASIGGEWVLPEPQPEVIENETDTENAP